MAHATTNTQSPTPEHRPYRLKNVLTDHTLSISCVKFSDDGKLFASASLDKTLIVYSTETLTRISNLIGHCNGVSDLSWSSCSTYICSASDDRTIRIWNVRDSECLKTLIGHEERVFCVSFSPATTLIASGGFDNTVRVWSVKTGKEVHVIRGHALPVTSVHFDALATLIVSGSHDGSCKIWDASNGSFFTTLIDDDGPAVSFAKFSPNGKCILVATLDNTIRLWNLETKQCLKTYTGHVNKVYCIISTFCVSGTVKYIVSGSEDNCIYLWNRRGENVVQKVEGHTDTVICVSCHPTESVIVSAGLHKDMTLRVWVQTSSNISGHNGQELEPNAS